MWARATERLGRLAAAWAEHPLHDEVVERFRPTLTADGWRYQALGRGEGAPMPYHLRWLAPKACGDDTRRWAALTWASLVALIPAMRLYTGNWAAGPLVLAAPGISLYRRQPVAVDPLAMTLAVLAAAAAKRHRAAAVVLSITAGAAKESAPVFAACYAWSPLPLIGLVAPALRVREHPGDDITDDFSHFALEHPHAAAWIVRRDVLTDPLTWITPWGALLAGARWDTPTITTLALAHAQCIRAVDTVRLTQWAAPVLARNLTDSTPREAWLAAIALTALNPWRGNGG